MKFIELTNELLQDFSAPALTSANQPFDNLWGIFEQELVRYSLDLTPDCEQSMRDLVSQAVLEIAAKAAPKVAKKTLAKAARRAMQIDPTIAIAPYVYPHLISEPTRYLVYGIQIHKSPAEELAEVSLRMLTLAMIKIAKENGENKITPQTLNSVKKWFCPLWPFWQKKDC